MNVKDILRRVNVAIHSRRGHNVLVFAVFLCIATLLWCVIALNDEAQTDIRMPVNITHVPDSVTIVSRVPQSM